MHFPNSPTNGQTHTEGTRTWIYNSTLGAWEGGNQAITKELLGVTGTNTGDQDLSGLVPYTGATNNVDLGSQSLSAQNLIYTDGTAKNITVLTEAAYDDLVLAGTVDPLTIYFTT